MQVRNQANGTSPAICRRALNAKPLHAPEASPEGQDAKDDNDARRKQAHPTHDDACSRAGHAPVNRASHVASHQPSAAKASGAASPTMAFTPAFCAITAPRYAAKLNSGPGMACASASPALNCSVDIQLSGESSQSCRQAGEAQARRAGGQRTHQR